jgi:hydrogenase nickel incorporation protein HypB
MARAIANAKQINPDIVVLRLSGRTGEGLEAWYEWLRREVDALRDAAFA